MVTPTDANSANGISEPEIIDISTGSRNTEPERTDVINEGDVIPIYDPASASVEYSSDSEPIKRRGRKPGSRNTVKAQKQTAGDLEGILFSLHTMAAALLKVSELQLDETEAKRLGDAMARVNALYGNDFFLSEKQRAWLNLMMVGGSIYGPRAVAYAQRVKKEKAEKKGPELVTQIPNQITR